SHSKDYTSHAKDGIIVVARPFRGEKWGNCPEDLIPAFFNPILGNSGDARMARARHRRWLFRAICRIGRIWRSMNARNAPLMSLAGASGSACRTWESGGLRRRLIPARNRARF